MKKIVLKLMFLCLVIGNAASAMEPSTMIIDNPRSITALNYSHKKLGELPSNFGDLINVQKLYLIDNQLTTLPDSISNLTNLTTLHLEDNQLTTLPESIGNLKKLEFLYLSNNKFESLPNVISQLTGLKYLALDMNPLLRKRDIVSSIKEILTKLPNLKILDIAKGPREGYLYEQQQKIKKALPNVTIHW